MEKELSVVFAAKKGDFRQEGGEIAIQEAAEEDEGDHQACAGQARTQVTEQRSQDPEKVSLPPFAGVHNIH
eukprot:2597416-Rhodomonas_salina.1